MQRQYSKPLFGIRIGVGLADDFVYRFISVISRHHPRAEHVVHKEGSTLAERMEPLWSPVVAAGGNQRQIDRARKPRKQAETVATGSDRSRAAFRGKEGVDGSSPSEGSEKAPHAGLFLFGCTCKRSRVR